MVEKKELQLMGLLEVFWKCGFGLVMVNRQQVSLNFSSVMKKHSRILLILKFY